MKPNAIDSAVAAVLRCCAGPPLSTSVDVRLYGLYGFGVQRLSVDGRRTETAPSPPLCGFDDSLELA